MKNDYLYYLSDNCCFDAKNCRIIDMNRDTKHALTKLQFSVLDYLIANKNNTLTYDDIIEHVWRSNDSTYQRNLSNIIYQLREILRLIDDSLEDSIQTHRGIGFSFECEYSQPKQVPTEKIKIISARELGQYAHTPITAARQLVQNDMEIFGDIGQNEGAASLWAGFIQAFPETFYCAINGNNEIVGNWSFCAPQKDQLILIENGQVKESEFKISNMNYINFPSDSGYYDGFLLNFSLIMAYRTEENEHLLFNSFAHRLLKWAVVGVYFRRIYVNVFTDDQKQLYENLGFTMHCQNVPNGIIYVLDMTKFPQKSIWLRHKQLCESYQKHFSATDVSI